MCRKTDLFVTILGIAFVGAHAIAEEASKASERSVLFTGADLPTPPQQGKPWKPPASSLPEKWVSAAEELYHCGLADPRGCEYREVKLTSGSSLWGGSSLVTAHAWVLPDGKDARPDRRRFAVTWTGIVYPVVEVGPPAKLASNVESLKRAFQAAQNDIIHTGHALVRGHPEFAERQMRLPPESHLVAHDCMFALKSCLLLRLGEGELASQVWYTWLAANPELMSEAKSPADDPYMVLAWEWGWALYDHAIAAHLRGDSVVALDSAKTLALFKESVPRVAARRGIDQRKSLANDALLDYLPLYDPPETLLEDATRRVKAGPIRRSMDVGLEKFPDQSQRIAALVRDLEDVSAGPEYKEGEVPLAPPYITYGRLPVNPLKTSPIVQSLIKEGEAAVEPLLKCLVDDRRLTRVAGAGHREISGDLLPPRDLITVDVAAYTALCGILKAEHFGPSSEDPYYNGKSREQRRAVAEEIRRRFEKIKGLPPEEAWLSVLADPDLTCTVWLEAAEKIVARLPRNEADKQSDHARTAQIDGRERILETDEDHERQMAGEVLRQRDNPSVTELLARCSDEAAAAAMIGARNNFDWRPVCDLTLCLARWDPKAAVPVIHRRAGNLRLPMAKEEQLAVPMANLIDAGLQAGERDLITYDYVAWIRATPPSNFGFCEPLFFMPLWRHPDNPKMADLARWLFLGEDSPWRPLHTLTPLSSDVLITSPLVGVPAFRELLKRELNNTSVDRLTREYLPIEVVLRVSDGNSVYAPDAVPSKPEAKRPLRICDYYAAKISALEGSPRFEPSWPEERRDVVRKNMARFLDQWGNRFRDRSKSLEVYYGPFSSARFYLPRLQCPAPPGPDLTAGTAARRRNGCYSIW